MKSKRYPLFLFLGTLQLSLWAFAVPAELAGLVDLPAQTWRKEQRAPIESRLKQHSALPTQLTIHYTGAKKNPKLNLSQKLQNLYYFSTKELTEFKKKLWGDVPYHFYIDMNGKVAEGRALGYQPDTNTSYNPDRHITIVVEGNDKDTLSSGQKQTLFRLMDAILKYYALSKSAVGKHKDFTATSCPGPSVGAAVHEYLSRP